VAAQFVPRPEEAIALPYETADPLADDHFQVAPRVIHHYRDRVLILATDRCATYCRHCFRRHFTAGESGRITREEVERAAEYLAAHPECREALVSGGDPLTLPRAHLRLLLSRLRSARPDLLYRVATRMPVVQPAAITRKTTAMLAGFQPMWIVIQANHPAELTHEFRRATGLLIDHGLPILNQTVLLRGVNDDADTLERLFRGLVSARIKPYYLFQGDLATGTSHFRTSIDAGLRLMRELRGRLTGLALPTYAVDLPGGGGKIALNEASVARREADWYVLRDPDGTEYRYPRES
jgi:lysine 2,3-aminomutase